MNQLTVAKLKKKREYKTYPSTKVLIQEDEDKGIELLN